MKKKPGNRMRKVSIVMERFWLSIAIATLLVVLYIFISEGIDRRTLQYLIFPVLAGSMYAFRYLFRKRMEGKDRQ